MQGEANRSVTGEKYTQILTALRKRGLGERIPDGREVAVAVTARRLLSVMGR